LTSSDGASLTWGKYCHRPVCDQLTPPGALLLDQHAAQDLARRRARDGGDEAHRADALVGRDALRHPGHELLRVERLAGDHDRHRRLARDRVRSPDDRGVGDRRMRGEDGLELRRRDLEGVDLDELLESVDDEDLALLVEDDQVAGAGQPPASIIAAVASGRCRYPAPHLDVAAPRRRSRLAGGRLRRAHGRLDHGRGRRPGAGRMTIGPRSIPVSALSPR
jgi:hypothetical protein